MRHSFDPDRRNLLEAAGCAGLVMAGGLLVPALGFSFGAKAQTQTEQAADHTIRIAPLSHEIAPGKVIRTTAYNGSIPGPALRLLEGKPVKINLINDSGYPNLVHWHGLHLPSQQDGATEEGSPIIPPGQSLTYALTPKPAGTRWYHSHAMAMTDLNRSTYTGEFGFLVIEPSAGDPGSYDRE